MACHFGVTPSPEALNRAVMFSPLPPPSPVFSSTLILSAPQHNNGNLTPQSLSGKHVWALPRGSTPEGTAPMLNPGSGAEHTLPERVAPCLRVRCRRLFTAPPVRRSLWAASKPAGNPSRARLQPVRGGGNRSTRRKPPRFGSDWQETHM